MPPPAKFLFDQDFAAAAEVKPAIQLAVHEAGLTAADAAGYRRGFAAAKVEILVEAEQRSAAALAHIAATLENVVRGLSGVEARLETEAVDVAVAVAKKLAAALIEREPLAEISALAMDCFRHLVNAPHVVVRVNDAQHGSVGKPIEEMVRNRGLAGHLVVLATAASNGPTAASTAIAAPPRRRSTKRSHDMSKHGLPPRARRTRTGDPIDERR
jgi:flagellar assembly protein FliH